jgi:hypothetical protein
VQSTVHTKYRSGRCGNRAHWLGVLALTLLFCGFEHGAAAAPLTQCLTAPVVLPKLAGVPNWFGPDATSDPWRAELNDPRWAGAAPFSLCTNPDLSACPVGLEQAEFRAFVSGTQLYVAVHVLADDVTNADDAVFIGVGRASDQGAVAAMIVPDTTTAPVAVGPGIVSDPTPPVRNATATTTKTWWASHAGTVSDWNTGLPPASPTWLQSVATWKNSPGVAWAITAVIDLAQLGYSLPLTQEARLFVGTRFVLSTDGAVVLPTPADAAATIGHASGTAETIIPANKNLWTQFDTPAYCTDGVLLTGTFIGVWDGVKLTSKIKSCPPAGQPQPAGCPNATNTFLVKPRYVPAPFSTTTFGIKAKIYLSNWGLLPADKTKAPWTPVYEGCGGPGTGWGWTDSASGTPTIQYECGLSPGSTYCPDITQASSEPKQAMLVELCPNGDVRYRQNASYRNMTFSTLSALDDTATLVMPPVEAGDSGAPREVQVLVRTYNMPARSNVKRTLPLKAMNAVLDYANHPPLPPRFKPVAKRPLPAPRGRAATPKANAAPLPTIATQEVGSFTPLPTAQLATAALAERKLNPLTVPTLTAESAFRQVWPTYMVYGYLERPGETCLVNGKPRAVLEPMIPYGYYLTHAKEFYGFTHSLSPSVAAQPGSKLPAGVYKLSVPGNAAPLTLTTKIATVDTCPTCNPPPPPPAPPPGTTHPNPTARSHCYCDVPGRTTGGTAGLGLAAAALALALRVYRARRLPGKPRA